MPHTGQPDYQEIARGSFSQGRLGFSLDGGRGATSYRLQIEPPPVSPPPPPGVPPAVANPAHQIEEAVTDLLGGVDLRVPEDNGQLVQPAHIRRFLPRRHPFIRNLVVTSVTDIQGAGKHTPQDEIDDLFLPVIDGYPLYAEYELAVEFTPTPYNIYPDSQVVTQSKAYFNAEGTLVQFNYCDEWIRYVDWTEVPTSELLTYKQGQMVFQTSDNAPPGAASPASAAQYQGTPYQTLPDSVIKMKWFRVPLRFITSKRSYIRNCPLGVVNQFAWFYSHPASEVVFTPGMLRYGGYTVTQYDPPIRSASTFIYPGVLDTRKMCDVEFTFFRTNRDRFAERNTPLSPAPPNGNWLAQGWNLQPWALKPGKYFYTHGFDPSAPTDTSKWQPHHNSFPFELFFTDPEAFQPDRANMIEVRPLG